MRASAQLTLQSAEEIEADAEREADQQRLLFERLLVAIKNVCLERRYSSCGTELQRIWGPKGRHVDAARLRACLEGEDRSYFRLEWVLWFAQQSEEVAGLLVEAAGRAKTAEQELADLKLTIAEEYPRQAQKLIRKAETR